MNDEFYMSYIEDRLITLQSRIILRSSLNILNLHVRAEDFFRELFNLIFKYQLVNANTISKNADAIDLIDENRKIIFQVTSTATKEKIEKTLSKQVMKEKYHNFTLFFLFIGKDAENLKDKQFENSYQISFDPKLNIYTVHDVLKTINTLNIDEKKSVYELVCKYLDFRMVSTSRVTSLLPRVIKSLCETDLENVVQSHESVNVYEIERKIEFNLSQREVPHF